MKLLEVNSASYVSAPVDISKYKYFIGFLSSQYIYNNYGYNPCLASSIVPTEFAVKSGEEGAHAVINVSQPDLFYGFFYFTSSKVYGKLRIHHQGWLYLVAKKHYSKLCELWKTLGFFIIFFSHRII